MAKRRNHTWRGKTVASDGSPQTSPVKSEAAADPRKSAGNWTPLAEWAERINAATAALSATSSELNRLCAAAKAALSPADRERLCAKLTMGRDIFYKRAAVGADGWMNDSGNARHLPLHSFSTMYEIKLMEIPERHAAIEAGVINPSMTRVDLERWNEERAARTSPTGPTKPPKASAIPYASILFVEPVSADGVRRVDGLLAELRVLPGVKVSLSQKPTERQYERAVRRWESRVEAVKRRLVRQAVKTELEHDLGRKPKGVTKAEYLLSLGHDPADYEVPKNADDEHLMHVLDHFNRSAQFEDMCRQCAVPPLRHLRANRRSDRSWLRLD